MRISFLVLLLVFVSAACSAPCSNLRERDEKIMRDFQELQAQNLPTSNLKYLAKLKVLYEKEQALLDEVRSCEITDPADYNYWYGKRLKYPSELEKTYIKLKP
jgi:hypothetical protein